MEQQDGSVALTRAGNFRLDSESNLVTQGGLPVLDDSGVPINLPNGEVTGTSGGVIYVDNQQVAQLGLVKVIDDRQLYQKEGTLLLTDDANMESAVGDVVVQHGALEGSNVNSVLAMTEMVATLRAYESSMKVVEQYNQLAGQLSSSVGKISG